MKQFFRILLNPSGRLNSTKQIPNPQATNNAMTPPSHVYFEAKSFHNNLDNENDYYLKLSKIGEKNIFVRKDEINDPENIR